MDSINFLNVYNRIKSFVKVFLIYFVGFSITLIIGYKTGIRGYEMRHPMDWEELYHSLPEIAVFAFIVSTIGAIVYYYHKE